MVSLFPLPVQGGRTFSQPPDCSKHRCRVCPVLARVEPGLRPRQIQDSGSSGVTLSSSSSLGQHLCVSSTQFHPFHLYFWSSIHTPALCQVQMSSGPRGIDFIPVPTGGPSLSTVWPRAGLSKGRLSGELQGAPSGASRTRLGLPHSLHGAFQRPRLQGDRLGVQWG